MNKLNRTPEGFAAYFEYLDVLRESGKTNMYGAGPYVVRKFKLSDDDARAVVLAWMHHFSEDKFPLERAKAALAEKVT